MRTIISYEPLWKTLQEKGISQYYLLQNGLDNKTLDSLKKGKNITLLTLEKLWENSSETIQVQASDMEHYTDHPDVILVCVKGYSLESAKSVRRH